MSGLFSSSITFFPCSLRTRTVELPLLLTNLSKKEKREHVEAALNLVGLGDRMKHYPKTTFRRAGTTGCDCPCHRYRPYDHRRDEPTGDLDKKSAERNFDTHGAAEYGIQKNDCHGDHDPHAAGKAH